MTTYLYSGRTSDGKQVTDRIEAATSDAARYALDLRGYREIVFHTDDSTSRVDALLLDEMLNGDPVPELTPEQEREARQSGGVLQCLWFAWKVNAIFWVPLSIWVGISLAGGRPFSVADIISFVFGGLFLVYFVWLVLPGVGYQRFLVAATWNRLGETRAWVRFLRFFGSIGPARIPKLELDMRLAWVLSRNGHQEEARGLIAPHESIAANNAMILNRLGGFYDAIGDHERAHTNRTQAVEVSGGGTTEIIDHALGLVRHLRRPTEARASLDRISGKEVADLVRIFVVYTEGLIALEEGRNEEAFDLLTKTEQVMSPYVANELMKGMRREVWAFQAIALGTAGRYAEANQLFLKALPLLKARRENTLIARCSEFLPRTAESVSQPHGS